MSDKNSNFLSFVVKERKEQKEKHNFSNEDDDRWSSEQLKDFAIYALTLDAKYWPQNFYKGWRTKLDNKPYPQRLIIANAVLLAEGERLERAGLYNLIKGD